MKRSEALTHAHEWAKRAEEAAQAYPHMPSSEYRHAALAIDMAKMWSALAGEMDYEIGRPVVDLQLPHQDEP